MLLSLLRNGFSIELLIGFCASLFVVFCTLPVHEFAHAWSASRLGDPTARAQGRLTLNPLAHIDPIGALMILLVGFGYAKPVPVNPRYFKKPKYGMAITALAGPLSNLLMALIFLLLFNVVLLIDGTIQFEGMYYNSTVAYVAMIFFQYAASINISLAVFNLIPIPPLDGSRILSIFLPTRYYFKIMQYERYIMIALMVLLFTGALTTPLSFLSKWVFSGFSKLAMLPFLPFI